LSTNFIPFVQASGRPILLRIVHASQTLFWINSASRLLPDSLLDPREPHQIQSTNLCFTLTSGPGAGPQGQIRVGMSKAAVFLAWGNPDRIRSGERQGHPFEAWIYTTTRTIVLPDYYYAPGLYFRGGVWRHHHRFYTFGLYSYPFDPYPYVVADEVPYKIAYFEGDRCTGWEYLR
jgi:hypothetical protein